MQKKKDSSETLGAKMISGVGVPPVSPKVQQTPAPLAFQGSKGVRHWLEQRQTPEEISVSGIIELTKGAYGADKFKDFFAAAVTK